MKKTKIDIGIPYFGRQDALFWGNLVNKIGLFPKMGLEYNGLHVVGAMLTDKNRNNIVERFLSGTGDWLFWIDADTIVPDGAIKRLLALNKTLASGLYYGKGEGKTPIAYVHIPEIDAYKSIEKVITWERGEILPVDSCGMGCILTHRSVFEDIKKAFTPFQRKGGGITLVRNDNIKGEVVAGQVNKSDGKVIQGQERVRLIPPTIPDISFPYFILEYTRTEDMKFFEIAAEVGHKPWLDTSIECGHIRSHPVEGKDYREAHLYKQRIDAAKESINAKNS